MDKRRQSWNLSNTGTYKQACRIVEILNRKKDIEANITVGGVAVYCSDRGRGGFKKARNKLRRICSQLGMRLRPGSSTFMMDMAVERCRRIPGE